MRCRNVGTNSGKRSRRCRGLYMDYVSNVRSAASSCVAALLFVAISLIGLVCPDTAFAQSGDTASRASNANPATPQHFDIPSQPLEDALYAFDTATGIDVFVDGGNVGGRRSMTIQGYFTPLDALRTMLAGTGLEAETIGPKAITLALSEPQDTANSSTYRNYSALVQNAVVRALCADPDIRPGGYRIAVQLWLAPTGIVSAANLLSSTGNPDRDRRVRRVLAGIAVSKPPPSTLPQPVIMVILPRPPQESGDCS
jgi:hypothetical protein